MTSAFQLTGGAADKIRLKITDTNAHDVAGDAERQTPVVWFQCNEVANAAATLTVAIYDATAGTSTYLGDGTSTWIATAMAAKQSVSFLQGFMLEPNEFLRITLGSGSVDVAGLALLSNN